MRILYVQNESFNTLGSSGISNCFFKYFEFGVSKNTYTDKMHFHNGFEIHFIIKGQQIYEINGEKIAVSGGSVLVIPPKILHRVESCDEGTRKVAVTFDYDISANKLMLSNTEKHLLISIDEGISENIAFIISKAGNFGAFSHGMIENRVYEIVVALFFCLGMKDGVQTASAHAVPLTLKVAEQFIDDNIDLSPSVTDVALYCNISGKQLYRIFMRYEGVSVFDYIRNRRAEKIRGLLEEKILTLKEISEKMSFPNEYYFNSFFKKIFGMPPGEYRNSV